MSVNSISLFIEKVLSHKSLTKICFFACLVGLLLLQPYIPGFQQSLDHHSWMSAQHLSIIMNTSYENYLNGYSVRYWGENGNHYYEYINRVPAWPAMLLGAVISYLPYSDSFKIHFSRQLMNLIFLLCMYLVFLVLRRLKIKRNAALAAVLLIYSSRYFMAYKDMISYIALGLLGFLLVSYAIARYSSQRGGGAAILYFLVFIGVSLGEAAPGLFVLLSWFLADMASIFFNHYKKFFSGSLFLAKNMMRILGFLLHRTSARALALGTILIFLYISWNIWSDMSLNQLSSWKETGVYDSIIRRATPASPSDKIPSQSTRYAWWNFFKSQLLLLGESLIVSDLILKNISSSLVGLIAFLFLSLSLFPLLKLYKEWNREERCLAFTILVSGFFYLFTLRRMTAFHDFTVIFYVGFCALLFAAVLHYIPTKASFFVLLFSFVFFIFNLFTQRAIGAQHWETIAWQPREFENIQNSLPNEAKIYYPKDGSYGLEELIIGFFLRKHWMIKNKKNAQYIISTKSNYNPYNITPKNKHYFLFQNK